MGEFIFYVGIIFLLMKNRTQKSQGFKKKNASQRNSICYIGKYCLHVAYYPQLVDKFVLEFMKAA